MFDETQSDDKEANVAPAEAQPTSEASAPPVPAPDPLAQAQEELTVQRAANEALVQKLNAANAKLAKIAELARLD